MDSSLEPAKSDESGPVIEKILNFRKKILYIVCLVFFYFINIRHKVVKIMKKIFTTL